jgi:iron(III) transport system substrate-binding protein
VLLYNINLIKPEEAPNSIDDFINPKWKGQCAIANPLFGTTSFHAAALFSTLGDSAAQAFFAKLKANEVIVATSNGDVRKRVADGQVEVAGVRSLEKIVPMKIDYAQAAQKLEEIQPFLKEW